VNSRPFAANSTFSFVHFVTFAVPILRAFAWAFPVAFDEGDKVTDKARDKVNASPEGA
jgi:hypothetical protein